MNSCWQRGPEDLTAINNLGVFYSSTGRSDLAVRQFRRALELRPGAALYFSNLVQNLVIVDDMKGADSVLMEWAPYDSSANHWVPYFRARFEAERGDFDRAYTISDSVARTDPGFRRIAGDLYVRQGRLRTAAPLIGKRDAAIVEGVIRGRSDAARQMLEAEEKAIPWDSVAANDTKPYSTLAFGYAVIGSYDHADALLARQARVIQPEVLRRDPTRLMTTALLTMSRGNAREGLQQLRGIGRLAGCTICSAFHEGQAFEKLSEPDSAIAQYERYVNGHNTDAEYREFFLAAALRRLGEMYESKGNRSKAIEYYGRFVDLWKNADPELQPLVTDIRKRVAELAGEPPRR